MNHRGKNDRNHEYQLSNDSASTPECILPFMFCKRNGLLLGVVSYFSIGFFTSNRPTYVPLEELINLVNGFFFPL